MSALKYNLSLQDDRVVTAEAHRIAIRDSRTILTFLGGCAPMIATLNHGEIQIEVQDGSLKTYPYETGFLRFEDGVCAITLLS